MKQIEMMPVQWVHCDSGWSIARVNTEREIYAVRLIYGKCLGKDGQVYDEPIRDRRDEAFLELCRFDGFDDAAKALSEYLEKKKPQRRVVVMQFW